MFKIIILVLVVLALLSMLKRRRRSSSRGGQQRLYGHFCRRCEHPYEAPDLPSRCRRCGGSVDKR
ncbi:MAG: hypothetical protein IPM23_02300 [Candidatus Melainabacteria bacterium]|nr:hypothetical protein [Candidatus Melainabacteria bacterium]